MSKVIGGYSARLLHDSNEWEIADGPNLDSYNIAQSQLQRLNDGAFIFRYTTMDGREQGLFMTTELVVAFIQAATIFLEMDNAKVPKNELN